MATHVLVIPAWRPTPLNQLLGHHMKAGRLKRVDRDMIAAYALLAGIPKAEGRRRVDLLVRPNPGSRKLGIKAQRRTDGDSPWKSTLDALKHAGLLVNDTVEWCQPGTYTPTTDGPFRTEVTLTDVGPGPPKGK